MHRHQWEEKERFWAPPPDRVTRARNLSPGMLNRLAFGITTIVYACSDCGRTYTDEILGRSG